MTDGRSVVVRLAAALQRQARPSGNPVVAWLLTRVGRSPHRFASTAECRQCGESSGVHVLRLGTRRARYWCERCGAVVSVVDLHEIRARDRSRPARPVRARPVAELAELMPAAMLATMAGVGRHPMTPERLTRPVMYQLYKRYDSQTSSALPSFPATVAAVNDSCYRTELAVQRLCRDAPTAGVDAVRERAEHARRWLAGQGAALCWLHGDGGEPDPASLGAAVRALRTGARPAADAGSCVRTALFGTGRGPMLTSLLAVYGADRLVRALEIYRATGERPLRADVLAHLTAPARTGLRDPAVAAGASPAVARPTPQTRMRQFAIGRATLTALLAGRGSYRLIQLAATVLLLPVWGAGYGTYAAAVASFSWLTALVLTGPEKTVLKMLPRAPRTGPLITEALLGLVWLLPVPLLLAFATVLVLRPGGPAPVYVGVATMQLGAGCTLLLIGLHRAAGRPRVDAGSFFVLSATLVVLVALAAAGYLQPLGYVTAVVGVQIALNATLAGALGRPSVRIWQRPAFLRRLVWTAVLMGTTDVCLYLTTGVLFAMLAASALADQVGRLFVIEVLWSAGVNFLLYVLRVYAPQISLRQTGRAAQQGRVRAGRLARAIAGYNAGWLAVVGVILAATELADTRSAGWQALLWTVLLVTRAPAVAGLIWSGYLLENTDAGATRVTGLAALVGLATATVTGLIAVPALGGVGVIVSVAVAEAVQALVIAARADPDRRWSWPVSRRPSDRSPAEEPLSAAQ